MEPYNLPTPLLIPSREGWRKTPGCVRGVPACPANAGDRAGWLSMAQWIFLGGDGFLDTIYTPFGLIIFCSRSR